MAETKSTSISDLTNGQQQQDNEYDVPIEEENISDGMYNRQMMGDVNEPMTGSRNGYQQGNIQHGPSNPPKTMMSSVISNIKSPVIVFIIFFVLNIEFVKKIVEGLLSKVLSPESPSLNLFGLILRSLLAAILSFVANYFIR